MHLFKKSSISDNTSAERHISRRDFLKKASLVSAVAAVAPSVLTSCSDEEITKSNRPMPSMSHTKGKMTYHYNANTGNSVSILGYGTMHLPLLRNAVETPEIGRAHV